MSESLNVKGFFRIQIEENNKIVGDSGWKENLVTNDGFSNYLVNSIMGAAGSKQIGAIALGTGGVPATNATLLPGEISGGTERKVPTTANNGSKTAQFTATFASSDSFLTSAVNLSNMGLYSATNSSDLFAGNTYASSSCNTNQNVNVTYEIRFS